MNETAVVDKCTTLLNRLETKAGPNCAERDLNIVMELLKVSQTDLLDDNFTKYSFVN